MALAVVLALGAGAWLYWQGEWIMPGVRVFGVDLGGKTRAESTATLATYWQQQQVVLQDGDDTLAVTPESLGMSFDTTATVDLAYESGRSPVSIVRALVLGEVKNVPPVWLFDAAKARDFLSSIAPRYEVMPVDASIQLSGGRVEVTSALPGRRLDVDATWNRLVANPAQVLSSGRLQLIVTPVQPQVTDVSAIARRVELLLSTAVAVRAYDPISDQTVNWELAPEVWGDWLTLDITDAAAGQFSWSVNQEQVRAHLTAQAPSLGSDRYLVWDTASEAISQAISNQASEVRLRVYHHPTQHVVQPGETLASIGRFHGIPYPWIQQANPGIGERLSVGQVLTIPSPDELLPLPVVENKRIVVSISQQRMWAYENGELRWEWLASTGIDSSPTAPGVFQIQTHESTAYASSWDLWMPYFMGIYRPVPSSSFMNGFHGFPTRDGANLLWTGNLGNPVTYGCILISTANATELFEWADPGVVVAIQQ